MEGALTMAMKAKKFLEGYPARRVSPGGGVYLNCVDSINFILQCKKHKIPIWGIDIVKVAEKTIMSPLDKTIAYRDQKEVYVSALEFVRDQMDDEWNYATIVTG